MHKKSSKFDLNYVVKLGNICPGIRGYATIFQKVIFLALLLMDNLLVKSGSRVLFHRGRVDEFLSLLVIIWTVFLLLGDSVVMQKETGQCIGRGSGGGRDQVYSTPVRIQGYLDS